MELRARLGVAAVVAAAAGLAEGAVRCITRGVPVLHAAHKVSVDVLWVAPLVDLALFLGLALALHVAMRLAPESARRVDPAATLGLFAGIGAVTVAIAAAVLHPVSIGLLGLGAAALAYRWARAREGRAGEDAPRLRPSRTAIALSGALLLVAGLAAALSRPVGERLREADLPAPPAGAPNVLVLMLDTVRRDSFLGSDGERLAPHLLALARAGTWYENAWSVSSWSLPTQVSVLVGSLPHEHGGDWPDFRLRADATTLPERLAARGYATGAFSGNSSWITPEYMGRGFLRFRAYVLEDLVRRTSLGRGLDRMARALSFYAAGRGKEAPRLHRELLDFIDDHPDRPFFAYVCYMDVNQALYARRFNHYFRRRAPMTEVYEAYEEGLRRLDERIGALLVELERRGLRDSTLIVVTSDHGESFGPEVRADRLPHGHGTSLYPEQTRVPLFVVQPGRVPGGARVRRPVSIASIPATIARLAGLELGSSGIGLAPPLPLHPEPSAVAPPGEEPLMTLRYEDRDQRSIATLDWQYIVDRNAGAGAEELIGVRAGTEVPSGDARRDMAARLDRRWRASRAR